MKKSKTKRKLKLVKTTKVKPEKLKLVNFKASKKERAVLKKLADKNFDGVVSQWIRHVALDPRFLKSDRVRISAKRAA